MVYEYEITGVDEKNRPIAKLVAHFSYRPRPAGAYVHWWVMPGGWEKRRGPGDIARWWPETKEE